MFVLTAVASALDIPTSQGNGADTYLSNDSNRGPTVTHGTKAFTEIRQFTGTRLRLTYLRFDLSGVNGDLSGATITLKGTTINADRSIVFHGLHESPAAGLGEAWAETSISYSNASGLDATAPLGTFALTADATASPVASTSGSATGPITTDPSPALDAFLAADTNGLVTFIVIIDPAEVTTSEYFTLDSKEGSVAPVLTLPNASIAPANDVDGDGLEDAWEDFHFGDGNGTASAGERALYDGADDPDGDGVDNEAEESAATDPNDGAAYPGGAEFLYVAPEGDDANPGTIDEPFATVGRAQVEVAAGSTVYFRGGAYAIDVSEVAEYTSIFAHVFLLDKDGSEGSPIRYWAYPGEEPVFDLSAVTPSGYRVYTFHITGDWLHFRGLTMTGVQVTITTHTQSICFDNHGSHNIFERLVMRDNQAIGMWIAGGRDNLVLNCDAYRNWDHTSEGGVGGNVDGFGCHYAIGPGNTFRGCRAWFNSDDGYDLINADSPVVIEHCWAAYNGYDYNFVSRGDGNGFKAGGYGSTPAANLPDPIPCHVVRDCLAVGNKQSGFYANHHPGGLTFIGNTALRNKRNFNMLCRLPDNTTDVDGYDHILRNNLGYNATLLELANADLAACDSSHNYWELPVSVDASDFQSLDESFLTAPRQASGELPVVPLMRLVSGSDLIDQGHPEGDPFAGPAPDLGCHEDGLIELGLGSFELPVVSLPATGAAGAVWSFSGASGIRPDPSAAEGGQVGFLNLGGVVSQFCDGFVPGMDYHVHLEALAPVGAETIEVWIDGVSLSPAGVGSAGFQSVDRMFTASASQHAIAIATPGVSSEVRIDALRVSVVDGDSDTDHDLLPDAWEFLWFGSLVETASGDADGDGSSNAVEEALHLDPSSGHEAFRCGISPSGELTWPGAAGIEFIVQRSLDLAVWVDVATVPGSDGVISYLDPAPPAGTAFYRVSFGL